MTYQPRLLFLLLLATIYSSPYSCTSCCGLLLSFIAFDRSPARFRGCTLACFLLAYENNTRLPYLPLHSCLLSPTGLPLVLPYSIPPLGSSLVRISTSPSSHYFREKAISLLWNMLAGLRCSVGKRPLTHT